MADRYGSFAELSAQNVEAVDYRIVVQDRGGDLLVMAPHGGKIERGTSEIARDIAGEDRSLYLFEGLKPGRNRDLHIASENYGEPLALARAARADRIVTVHGRDDVQQDLADGQTTWVGGRDEGGKTAVVAALRSAGFAAIVAEAAMTGRHPNNICNLGASGAGIQLEIPRSLRDRLMEKPDLRQVFADAVRRGSV